MRIEKKLPDLKTIVILKLFALTFSSSAHSIDTCSLDFLGLGGLINKSQAKRVSKVTRLENTVQFIRNLKANSNMVEIDRKNIERLIKFDSGLYEGNIYLAEKTWRPFFRKFESNFYQVKKQAELLKDVNLNAHKSVDDIVNNALLKFENDPFMLDLILSISKTKLKGKNHLIKIIEKRMNKSANYIGRNYIQYRLTTKHLDDVIHSKSCDSLCKEGIEKLRGMLGVSGLDEQIRFPAFKGLSSPALEDVSLLVNSIPNAYESVIFTEMLSEAKAFLRDIYTLPNARRALAKTLSKALPEKYKTTASAIDSALTDLGAYTNHFPLINRVLRSQKTIEAQFSRLRNQNVLFPEDEMLITFARRVDERAHDGWKDLKKYAKGSNEKFYQRMLKAEEEALVRGELSNDYRKSPFRAFIYIVGSAAAYPMYGMFFESKISELTELEELREHFEIKENSENPDLIELHLKSEEAKDFIIDMVTPMAEGIKQAKKQKSLERDREEN